MGQAKGDLSWRGRTHHVGSGLAMVLALKLLVGVAAIGLEVGGYRALDCRSHDDVVWWKAVLMLEQTENERKRGTAMCIRLGVRSVTLRMMDVVMGYYYGGEALKTVLIYDSISGLT